MSAPASNGPRLSVIVPVKDGAEVLPRCLDALDASELSRSGWELIVVDDGSSDGSGELAADRADLVVRVRRGPRGPAWARNLGAGHANGSLLLFIDADVVVHPDTLSRVVGAFAEDPELGAVFGAYDSEPHHPSFLSQYRNLLHRYVHLKGAGEADTFWAGCGAVRITAFHEVGGFDAERFPRPQIEDIELGYRLRAAGHRIEIQPEIQVKHLKRWTFRGMVRTDFLDRAVPWMRLIIGREAPAGEGTLNVQTLEKLKTALLGTALMLAAAGLLLDRGVLLVASAAALAVVIALNAEVYRWFARQRGWGFAVRVIPFHVLYYFLSGLAVVLVWGQRLLGRSRSRAAPGSRLEPSEEDGAAGSPARAGEARGAEAGGKLSTPGDNG